LNLKKIDQLIPPVLLLLGRRFVQKLRREAPEWEYMPMGWSTQDQRIKGWNDPSIVEAQEKRWSSFSKSLEGAGPLGVSLESPTSTWSIEEHNTLMCYAYVLALAARRKDKLTILDWGGGAGHYYPISKALLREVEIDYSCFDEPLLCKLGRRMLPEVEFYDTPESVLGKSYDLVVASSSLQYFEKWSEAIRKLASVTVGYLYVTRLPIVIRMPSFVVVQRPYRHGYKTEYLGWFLNRESFLLEAKQAGCELIREFCISGMPIVKGAPEQGESRGFLFRKERSP